MWRKESLQPGVIGPRVTLTAEMALRAARETVLLSDERLAILDRLSARETSLKYRLVYNIKPE